MSIAILGSTTARQKTAIEFLKMPLLNLRRPKLPYETTARAASLRVSGEVQTRKKKREAQYAAIQRAKAILGRNRWLATE